VSIVGYSEVLFLSRSTSRGLVHEEEFTLGRVGCTQGLDHGGGRRGGRRAGPTDFGLARRLRGEGIECLVVAPSLIPVRQGCRIKTDRRDAVKLAQFLLRHERIWSGGTKWTQRHWAWIRQQAFAEPILVETSPLRPLVVALMALRGVRLVTAVARELLGFVWAIAQVEEKLAA
jgi:hypothetical protein